MAQRAMVGSPAATRRMFLFCLPLLVIIPESRQAVPWREKNVVKIATTLPSRLIDSIMAKGNWNLLFQEGPFAEFQRQIAIANHFTARGDQRQAEFYFAKAERTLDIAYASLRGKFGWPRSYSELEAPNLPSGENRDTFEDFVLCLLQLQIERAMAVRAEIPAAQVAQAEKRLGMPIGEKDTDLDLLIRFVGEAVSVRKLRADAGQLAGKFASLNDRSSTTLRNYWNRRLVLFRILENIQHGNLGRAYGLIRLIESKLKNQWDALHIARLYAQTGAFAEAKKILTEAIGDSENRTAENFAEQVRLAGLLQNIYLWERRYDEARQLAEATHSFLTGFADSSLIAREDILYLKQATQNENFKIKIFTRLATRACPDAAQFSANTDMELEWQVRERNFYESCGATADNAFWQKLVRNPGTSAEMRAIAVYRLQGDKGAAQKLKADSPMLAVYLNARGLLREATRRRARNLAQITIQYLRSAEGIEADLLFYDWGLDMADDPVTAALPHLAGDTQEKTAGDLFWLLHRRLILERLRIAPQDLRLIPAGDAALASGYLGAALLDQPLTVAHDFAQTTPFGGKVLWFRYGAGQLIFDPGKKREKLSFLKTDESPEFAGRSAVLFGDAPWAVSPLLPGNYFLPPSLAPCDDCQPAGEKTTLRLTILAPRNSPWGELRSELADNFTLVNSATDDVNCAPTPYEDTLLVAGVTTAGVCDPRVEKWVIEPQGSGSAVPAFLLTAGWRRSVMVLHIPAGVSPAARTAFLFDFFQRTNRRQVKPGLAFKEAKARAEKSFPSDTALQGMSYYESLP